MSVQDQEREEQFRDFVSFLDSFLGTIIPDVSYELDVDSVPQQAIYVNIHLDDPSKMGLVIGSGAMNISILQMWMRAQQIYPQDRYVHIKLHGEDDDVQWFSDKNVRKKFDYKVVRECDADGVVADVLFGDDEE